jgi:16S rRNA (uracil1498-N3)-methyltransferase
VLPLFFVDKLSGGNSQILDKDEAHHAIKVLRVKIGEEIMISDGSGNWVSGPIEELDKKTLLIKVSNQGEKRCINRSWLLCKQLQNLIEIKRC